MDLLLKVIFAHTLKIQTLKASFFTLTPTEDVNDKDTIKVVKLDPPVILTFTPVQGFHPATATTPETDGQSSIDGHISSHSS